MTHGGVLAGFGRIRSPVSRLYDDPAGEDVLTAELKMSFLRAAWGNELIAKGYRDQGGTEYTFL